MELIDNLPDFDRYYTHTWIAKREGETFTPVWVRGLGLNNSVIIQEVRGRRIEVPFNTILAEYSLSTPPLGMINVDNSVSYMEIIPARQFKKGLCLGRIYKLDKGGTIIQFQDAAVASFNPSYFTFAKALELVESKERRAAAFNPYFCLEEMDGCGFPVLNYRREVMGEVQDKNIVISPAFQEYEDTLRRLLPKGFRITQWKRDSL